MADQIIGASIPQINTQAIGLAANKAGYGFAVVSLYTLILLGIMGLIAFFLYRKTFDIKITILSPEGKIIKDGFRGKLVQKRKGEFKFRIFKAKINKLRYNEETFSPEDLYQDVSGNGKVSRRMFMTTDDEGQLTPVRFSFEKTKIALIDQEGKSIVDEHGRQVYAYQPTIRAKVKQVDVAWYYKELDKSIEVFDHRSFFDKNGWIIITICLILTLGVFLYTAYKFGAAASKMGDVVQAQSELIRFLEISRNSTIIPVG